jgi:hypothetical protein
MRAFLRLSFWLAALGMAASVWAQPAAPAPARDAGGEPGRANQRIEHIRVEDGGSRVDELRVGGQTRSITVQPKTGGPAYDVQPAGAAGGPLAGRAGGSPGAAGQRTWKVLRF